MSDDRAQKRGVDASNTHGAAWPVTLRGVTESIVATRGPNQRWNFAALGLHTSDGTETSDPSATPARAYTWGATRTRRNFHEHGEGYVQFARDPVLFVDATLDIHERDAPIHPSADAWVRATATPVGVETIEGTRREAWRVVPTESSVETECVPTTRRGYAAVVEATVAASRLDVPAYDTATLYERLDYFEGVIERCGDERERAAFARLEALIDRE